MVHESMQPRRFNASSDEDLLEDIDALALELTEAAEATGSGHVPISARADFLCAQAAHQRAVVIWTAASAQHQLGAVRDALEQCREALDSMRERLRC
jgi:hypothetical protein